MRKHIANSNDRSLFPSLSLKIEIMSACNNLESKISKLDRQIESGENLIRKHQQKLENRLQLRSEVERVYQIVRSAKTGADHSIWVELERIEKLESFNLTRKIQ